MRFLRRSAERTHCALIFKSLTQGATTPCYLTFYLQFSIISIYSIFLSLRATVRSEAIQSEFVNFPNNKVFLRRRADRFPIVSSLPYCALIFKSLTQGATTPCYLTFYLQFSIISIYSIFLSLRATVRSEAIQLWNCAYL